MRILEQKLIPPSVNSSSKKIKSIKSTSSQEKVLLNPFLDIRCRYSQPKDIGSFLEDTTSCISIFYNNIRSVNKNLDFVEEIFRCCKNLPSIIAISETKLSNNSPNPELKGYNFENIYPQCRLP